MKNRTLILTIGACVALLLVAGPGLAKKQPPPTDPPPTPVDGYYFWRLGHMEGPHDSSKTLGISRDGKTAVGGTLVVDFQRAWRCDIDWAIATDDGVPPLYNELQVQEDIGIIAPSRPSAAYASSDMTTTPSGYDLPNLVLDWGGSMPVGTITGGTVSYAIEWMLPVLDSVDEGDFMMIPDYGGGISDMAVKDVSADGQILVGTGNVKTGERAFRADMAVVDADLVPIPVQLVIQDAVTLQTLRSSAAEAVSADGMIIAGYGATNSGNRAFVTTVLDATTDPITLESTILPRLGGGKYAEAYAMTPDGTIIAGRSDSPKGPQACIWFVDDVTGEWVVKGLGGLSKKNLDSVATGVVYRPGSVVGGAHGRGQEQEHPLRRGSLRLDRQPGARGRPDRLLLRPRVHPHQDRRGRSLFDGLRVDPQRGDRRLPRGERRNPDRRLGDQPRGRHRSLARHRLPVRRAGLRQGVALLYGGIGPEWETAPVPGSGSDPARFRSAERAR